MAMLMSLLPSFGLAVIVSALFAACVAVAAWRMKTVGVLMLAAAAAAAAGLGYACGHLVLSGWPGFPPGDATHWLAFLAAGGVLLAVAERGLPQHCWCVSMLRVITGMAFACLLFLPLVRHSWTTVETLWRLGLAAVALVLLLGLLTQIGKRAPDLAVFATLFASLTCTSIALVISGSILLGQLAGVMCWALVPVAVTALFMRSAALGAACAVPAGIVYWGLLHLGYYYANLTAVAGGVLLLAPLGALTAAWLPRGRFLPKNLLAQAIVRATMAAAAVVIVGGIAVAISVHSSTPLDY